MILPRTRASFDRADAGAVVELLGAGAPELRKNARARLAREGLDALLDDPRTLNALLTGRDVRVSPGLVFYVLVRQALLEVGVDDRQIADYVTSLVIAFGEKDRAYRISDESGEEFHYLVDLVARLGEADSRDAFLVRSHMGNYALWLTGLFPDFVHGRVTRRGAPPIRYYEAMGSSGFLEASGSREARELGLAGLYEGVARDFSVLREALNRLADRHLWSGAGHPVERLLREVGWRFSDS